MNAVMNVPSAEMLRYKESDRKSAVLHGLWDNFLRVFQNLNGKWLRYIGSKKSRESFVWEHRATVPLREDTSKWLQP